VGQGRGAHQGVDLGCAWGLSGKTNGSAPTTSFKLDAIAVFVVTACVTQTAVAFARLHLTWQRPNIGEVRYMFWHRYIAKRTKWA
jgi:hypothetical protein